MKQATGLLYARSPQPLYLQVATIVRRNIEAGADSAEALHLPLSAPVAELRRYACVNEHVVYFARLEIPTRYVQMKFDLLGNR